MTGVPQRRTRRRVSGDILLHPVALGSVVLLLVNDHVLKATMPGLLTGKLSDIAAMVFCPLLIAALFEVVCSRIRRRSTVLSVRAAVVVCLVVATGFAAMKTFASAGVVYGEMVGWLRNSVADIDGTVAVAHDVTDAFCAVFVVVPAWVLIKRARFDLHLYRV